MKALLISALVFFALKAMSSEVGEELKTPCIYANQSGRNNEKVIGQVESDVVLPVTNSSQSVTK